jgi:hypothetical protein
MRDAIQSDNPVAMSILWTRADWVVLLLSLLWDGLLIGESILGGRLSADTPGGYETLCTTDTSIGMITLEDPRIFPWASWSSRQRGNFCQCARGSLGGMVSRMVVWVTLSD